jgi:hypothetical protein
MDMVKVINMWVEHHGQGHKVKSVGIHRKVLSEETVMWNIKALVHTIQKI